MYATVINDFVDFIEQLLLKFVSKLPSNPFNWDQYTSEFSSILGTINYFIPFYLFRTITRVWLVTFGATLAIVIIIRAIRRGGIG